MRLTSWAAVVCLLFGSAGFVGAQEAPVGVPSKISKKEQKKLDALKGKVNGKIVWSTSRENSKHDIWIMNADGTDKKALTAGDNVDWFPRFSPDGRKVLFVRSKGGWVPETDAKYYQKWDLWTINVDGTDENKVVGGACWGTWRPSGDSIVFARDARVFLMDLASSEEKMIFDADVSIKDGTIAQQPQLSPDGRFLAITLRGTSRETGIWNFEKKVWHKTGKGCQINWFSSNEEIYRMNPTGNGGRAAPSEVLHQKIDADGKPLVTFSFKVPKELKLIDIPGRRSHEYFPKFDPTDTWMVWAATDKGHDHDIYDYEIHIWKRGEKDKTVTRLTFHSGNDRWPDIFLAE